MAAPSELAERLKNPDARVRRVAAMDLARAGEAAVLALLAHLPGEADEKTSLIVIRALAEAGTAEALPVLARLRDNPATPIRIYHAAVLGHDRIERARGA